RHRRGIGASTRSGETPGEPRIPEIAHQDAERRAGHDPVEHEVGRKAEDADEEAREYDEVREVVHRETEERVDVAGGVPPTGRRLGAHAPCRHGDSASWCPFTNEFEEPEAAPRPARSAGRLPGAEERPGHGPDALTERRAPGEARPALGDFAVLE